MTRNFCRVLAQFISCKISLKNEELHQKVQEFNSLGGKSFSKSDQSKANSRVDTARPCLKLSSISREKSLPPPLEPTENFVWIGSHFWHFRNRVSLPYIIGLKKSEKIPIKPQTTTHNALPCFCPQFLSVRTRRLWWSIYFDDCVSEMINQPHFCSTPI